MFEVETVYKIAAFGGIALITVMVILFVGWITMGCMKYNNMQECAENPELLMFGYKESRREPDRVLVFLHGKCMFSYAWIDGVDAKVGSPLDIIHLEFNKRGYSREELRKYLVRYASRPQSR